MYNFPEGVKADDPEILAKLHSCYFNRVCPLCLKSANIIVGKIGKKHCCACDTRYIVLRESFKQHSFLKTYIDYPECIYYYYYLYLKQPNKRIKMFCGQPLYEIRERQNVDDLLFDKCKAFMLCPLCGVSLGKEHPGVLDFRLHCDNCKDKYTTLKLSLQLAKIPTPDFMYNYYNFLRYTKEGFLVSRKLKR